MNMKEKLLKEKGSAKVYIIIIVILVALCIALGAFAVINLNKEEDDDEKTSKKNETNTVQSENNVDDEKEDEDEDDEDSSKTIKYTGVLDMTEIMGTDELADTTWTLFLEGNDDSIQEMIITAELEKYFKETYETAGGEDSGYTYSEYVETIQNILGDSMESVGTQMATGLGVSSSDVDTTSKWIDDETLEIRIDLSKVDRDTYDVDKSESIIETVVEELKDAGVTMKKSK
ncbi:MAG: hypothetical protein J6K45_02400 [Clostridia bacterium]|nr:hypothetical protein [Clostridia bacterium]